MNKEDIKEALSAITDDPNHINAIMEMIDDLSCGLYDNGEREGYEIGYDAGYDAGYVHGAGIGRD